MGERIFVPSNVTDSVTAYQIEDGRELWRFYTDGPVRLAPAAWRERVYFSSDDGHLYCVDAETGELDWKFRAGPSDHRLLGNERIINFWAARGGPVIAEGIVYFAAGIWPEHGVFIYALDADSGDVVWVNDTTSSQYVRLPHGGARGFGGLSPQGYIAVDGDRLVVAPGRGQSPVYMDRHSGEVTGYSFRGSKGAGGYAVHSGGQGFQRNDMIERRVRDLSDEIDGDVFYNLAAHDRLFVTTECGKLYCFGEEEIAPRRYEYSPGEMSSGSHDWADVARGLIEQLGDTRGYALDYTRTCTCSYAPQTSLALVHMPGDSNIESWTRYSAPRPNPEGFGLNYGAPGSRVDVAGSGLVWHVQSGTKHRPPSAVKDSGGAIDWVTASVGRLTVLLILGIFLTGLTPFACILPTLTRRRSRATVFSMYCSAAKRFWVAMISQSRLVGRSAARLRNSAWMWRAAS